MIILKELSSNIILYYFIQLFSIHLIFPIKQKQKTISTIPSIQSSSRRKRKANFRKKPIAEYQMILPRLAYLQQQVRLV